MGTLHPDDWILVRKFVLELILATDLTKHFNLLGVFRTRAIQLNEIDLEKKEDLLFCLQIGLKCADINHSAKPLDLHIK